MNSVTSIHGNPSQVNRAYSITTNSSIIDPEWDAFVAKHPNGHHEQSSGWGRVKAGYGWRPVRIKFFCENTLIGGAQMLVRDNRLAGRIGYIAIGPVIPEQERNAWPDFLQELLQFCRRQRLRLLIINFPYHGEWMLPALQKHGFNPHPSWMPPTGLMEATLVCDLRKCREELLMEMCRNTRRGIYKSLRSGCKFEVGGRKDLDRFRALMVDVCTRLLSPPSPPQRDFFHRLWDQFGISGRIELGLVSMNGIVEAGLLGICFGKWMRAWKKGWSGKYQDHFPNEFMLWKMILLAKERGLHWFEIVGLSRSAAEAAIRGEPSYRHQGTPNDFFKLGFGGTPILMPGVFSRAFTPGLNQFLYSRTLNRFMQSSLARPLRSRLNRM